MPLPSRPRNNECQYRLLRVEKATHLFTNTIPQIIVTELVILGNVGTKLHQTTVGLRPIGRNEFVGGRPVDKFGTATTGTRETGIVQIGLELRDIIGQGCYRGNA
jgi:hypothetical protein